MAPLCTVNTWSVSYTHLSAVSEALRVALHAAAMCAQGVYKRSVSVRKSSSASAENVRRWYELKLTVSVKGAVCDSVKTRFGIRDITSDTNTPVSYTHLDVYKRQD